MAHFHFFGDCLGDPVFPLETALVAQFSLWRLPLWPSFHFFGDCLGGPVFTLETAFVAQFSLWRLPLWPSFHFGDCFGVPAVSCLPPVAQIGIFLHFPQSSHTSDLNIGTQVAA